MARGSLGPIDVQPVNHDLYWAHHELYHLAWVKQVCMPLFPSVRCVCVCACVRALAGVIVQGFRRIIKTILRRPGQDVLRILMQLSQRICSKAFYFTLRMSELFLFLSVDKHAHARTCTHAPTHTHTRTRTHTHTHTHAHMHACKQTHTNTHMQYTRRGKNLQQLALALPFYGGFSLLNLRTAVLASGLASTVTTSKLQARVHQF